MLLSVLAVKRAVKNEPPHRVGVPQLRSHGQVKRGIRADLEPKCTVQLWTEVQKRGVKVRSLSRVLAYLVCTTFYVLSLVLAKPLNDGPHLQPSTQEVKEVGLETRGHLWLPIEF